MADRPADPRPGRLTEAVAPGEALAALAGCDAPWLIGVRHHSPSLARCMGPLLEARRPQRVFLELPREFHPWLDWVGHPELEAPVALAGVRRDGSGLAFYPFADFSPELAAIRWARQRGVPIEPFDLAIGLRRDDDEAPCAVLAESPVLAESEGDSEHVGPALLDHLLRNARADSTEELWDRLVEVRAPGAAAESVRRAALLTGYAMRLASALRAGIRRGDLRREAAMRERLAELGAANAVAVVGTFHAAALLPDPWLSAAAATPAESVDVPPAESCTEIVTSLIPYDFALLDSRSGYPAGIRDPLWQQSLLDQEQSPDGVDASMSRALAQICREIRGHGHPASVADGKEALRLCRDLARLRGLPAPGRRELLEAAETCLAQGEVLGRGRVVARALETVLVGTRRGRLAAETPRSGLMPHVEALLAELRLPGPDRTGAELAELRLDPLRSALDERRHVTLVRLKTAGIPYGVERAGAGLAGGETLGRTWRVQWTPTTAAMIELVGLRGVTLEQVARGTLLRERRRLADEDTMTTGALVELLGSAASCGLAVLTEELLALLGGEQLLSSTLAELLRAQSWVERIARGHVPGLPVGSVSLERGPSADRILAAAVAAVEGLAGSERLEDAGAILEVVQSVQAEPDHPAAARLAWALGELARDGSPLMQGAGTAARALMQREDPRTVGRTLASWMEACTEREGRQALAGRLQGALVLAGLLFEVDEQFLDEPMQRIDTYTDEDFLQRVLAMREGFDVLSPAARSRLLEVLSARLGVVDPRGLDVGMLEDPALLATFATADLQARRAVEQMIGQPIADLPAGDSRAQSANDTPAEPGSISRQDRWRLILGRETRGLGGAAGRCGIALEQLYGAGRGEGSRQEQGAGGGQGDSIPTAREWGEELEELFGAAVREEVLGKAAAAGHIAALRELDPEQVNPSVELLEQVLALRGALGEQHLEHLRRIVARVVSQLVEQLARRLQPALTGLALPRPTRRRGGPIDLRSTVRANLHTAALDDATGQLALRPETVRFHTRARRSLDWQIILVVDVSGSMEPSVIHSALMAAILGGLPAVRVHFVAFSTEIVDLSERVEDPLALLLEVQVGGGTHIAKGLAYARSLITTPARTLVITVTDFEEGFGVGGLLAEVRQLVASGARCLGLASLDDHGKPRYCKGTAELVAGAGMPVAALTPLELARWVAEQIR